MDVRVNPNIYGDLLNALSQSSQAEDTALQEVSTGRRVQTPSQDPVATSGELQVLWQRSQDDTFTQSVSSLQGQLQTGSSVLNTVVTALNQAISYGVEGGNSSNSAADQQALAQQVQQIQNQLVSLANTSYQGNYIFAGTKTQTVPFSQNLSTSVVTYNGNSGQNQVEVSPGENVTSNLSGDQIFTNPNGNVFQATTDLINALKSGGNVSSAVTEMNAALNSVSSQQTFYGSNLQQLNSVNTQLNNDTVSLSSLENTLVGIDPATAETNLSQAEVQREAALSAGAKLPQLSLLSYLQ